MKTSIYTMLKRVSVFKILILTLLTMGVGKTHAQNEMDVPEIDLAQPKHEVSVHLKGPFSGIQFKDDTDNQKMKSGFGLGINYNYYINTNWSLYTGLEIQSYNGEVFCNSIKDAYQTVDAEGEAFEFRYAAQDLNEELSATYLNIPIKVQYESIGKTRLYAAGGIKIGFNLKSEYESAIASLATSGYYSQYDAVLNAPEFMGFGQFTDIKNGKKDLNLKTDIGLDLETGVKFIMAKKQAFYFGLFLDYGLKDLSPHNSEQNFIAYNTENPTAFNANSALNSTNKMKGSDYIDKVHTLAYGLKIRYAFSL